MHWGKKGIALALALCMLLGCAAAQAEVLNVLLIGVDSSRGAERGRSDTMMLVRAEPETGEIRMVSFLRDLYVPISGVGKTRLNAAYAYGGEALLRQTLQEQFGAEIDRTVTLQFQTLCDVVDEVGGVEVEIAPRELTALNRMIEDDNASYGLETAPLTEAGLQTLNGRQALSYSRLRKIDSDFQRTSRQQTVLTAMLKKLSEMDTWQLLGLALRYLGQVETDLTLGDAALLTPMLKKELSIRTAQVPFEGAYTDETIGGMSVLVPNLEQNRKRLRSFWEAVSD